MSPDEYVLKYNSYTRGTIESGWFFAEVYYYSSIGRALDCLKSHLRWGCNFDKESFLSEMGNVLRSYVNLCQHNMTCGDFLSHDWAKSREMVPGGISGCANGLVNMLRSDDSIRRIHFFANACSHVGFTFDMVAQRSLSDLFSENSK